MAPLPLMTATSVSSIAPKKDGKSSLLAKIPVAARSKSLHFSGTGAPERYLLAHWSSRPLMSSRMGGTKDLIRVLVLSLRTPASLRSRRKKDESRRSSSVSLATMSAPLSRSMDMSATAAARSPQLGFVVESLTKKTFIATAPGTKVSNVHHIGAATDDRSRVRPTHPM